jgi:hypothetical protein
MMRRLSYVCRCFFALGVVMGIIGEVALSDWTRPPNWLELTFSCYYLGIILTAVGFGPEFEEGPRSWLVCLAPYLHRTKQSSARAGAALSNAVCGRRSRRSASSPESTAGGRSPARFCARPCAFPFPISKVRAIF